ncbi:viroplasmin family protein [Clostridium sp. cel8]|uniref:ribonuclease H1 domain-containing protein n=1 Tax=Clostridium sp. cel8 TaxID=2663123 RepID=UPI0015F575FF|nr:ribonuclease H family protein [Clostridium sp. cel8]MBA5851280.1 viroplasmin family protein [Clostridium sp. cel8]
MKKKFYAIKKGYDFKNNKNIENLIVDSWAECLKYVKGAKGAVYKSFKSRDEAEDYLNESYNFDVKKSDIFPDIAHIYVDGSYNISTEKYAYALVVVKKDVVEYVESKVSEDNSKKSIRQVAGELEAAVKAAEYAIKNNEKHIVIFHDYEGIANHVTGLWERKSESSREYYNSMKRFIDMGLDIKFSKVSGHSGDLFNDIADEKAKEAVGIESKNVVYKWLKKNKLKVKNEEIKSQFRNIARDLIDNVIIEN